MPESPPQPERGLIPALRVLQEQHGHVPASAIPQLASQFGVSQADVYGVISFYTDLTLEKQGTHILRVCLGESCYAMKCKRVLRAVVDCLGVGLGETTPDGRVSVQVAYCLGNCALSPSIMLDGRTYGRMTEESVAELLRDASADISPPRGHTL